MMSAKRCMDLTISSIGLVLLSPVLVVIALVIRCTSRGPAFYRAERIGLEGEPFELLKFRTMVDGADRSGPSSTAGDDPRITSLGLWLRRWKLDELPQLINVVRADMSLVGPRPQVAWAVARYDDDQRRLLSVRPGITDWASIEFSNEAEILAGHDDPDAAYLELIEPEKIRLGLEYVDRQSLKVDVDIIRRTIAAILNGGRS